MGITMKNNIKESLWIDEYYETKRNYYKAKSVIEKYFTCLVQSLLLENKGLDAVDVTERCPDKEIQDKLYKLINKGNFCF